MKMNQVFGASLILSLAAVAAAQTPPAPTPAERAIEYRQAVYKVVAGNFGPLAGVAQGKAEFKADVAGKSAARLAQIATFVGDAYPDISKDGKTRALPEIWTNRVEFDALVKDFVTHTAALAKVTQTATNASDEYKAAVGAVGNDCKSCHEKFRSK